MALGVSTQSFTAWFCVKNVFINTLCSYISTHTSHTFYWAHSFQALNICLHQFNRTCIACSTDPIQPPKQRPRSALYVRCPELFFDFELFSACVFCFCYFHINLYAYTPLSLYFQNNHLGFVFYSLIHQVFDAHTTGWRNHRCVIQVSFNIQVYAFDITFFFIPPAVLKTWPFLSFVPWTRHSVQLRFGRSHCATPLS